MSQQVVYVCPRGRRNTRSFSGRGTVTIHCSCGCGTFYKVEVR